MLTTIALLFLCVAVFAAHKRIDLLSKKLKQLAPAPLFPDVCPGAGGRCKAPTGGVHDPHCAFGGRGLV